MRRRHFLQAIGAGAGMVKAWGAISATPRSLSNSGSVPDTLNLEDHARLSLNYMPSFRWFNALLLSDPPALKVFSDQTGTTLFNEGLIYVRLMTEDAQHDAVGRELRKLLLADSRIGTYMLLSLSTAYYATGEIEVKEKTNGLVSSLWKGMVKKDGKWTVPSPDLSKFDAQSTSAVHGVRRELLKAFAEDPLTPFGSPADVYPYNTEGLVRVYEATGNESALELARFWTHYVMYEAGAFREDGSFILSEHPVVNVSAAFPESWGLNVDPRGHLESRLRAVLGVLRYGMVTGERELIEWSRRVFDWVQAHLGSEMGWYHENASMAEGCETCGVVCMLEIAVLLARSGYPEYWNIVERITRNHLIESQLRDISWVKASKSQGETKQGNGEVDYERVAERMKGGFGGWTDPMDWVGVRVRTEASPQIMNCCVTGTHGLYWAWHHIVTKDEKGVWVNLALNRDTKWVRVASHQPYQGRVDVLVHEAPVVHIRVPDWVDKRQVALQVEGKSQSLEWAGSYVKVANLRPGQTVTLLYALREVTRRERIGGREYSLTWKGDTVLEIVPQEERWVPAPIYPLYQRKDYRKNEAPLKQADFTVPEKEIHW